MRKFVVKINGHILRWEDGEYKSNNKRFLKQLKELCEQAEESEYIEFWLDGSLLYANKGIDPQKKWAIAYAFLDDITGGSMEFISGDKPTWEKLGFKNEEETTY